MLCLVCDQCGKITNYKSPIGAFTHVYVNAQEHLCSLACIEKRGLTEEEELERERLLEDAKNG